MSDMVDILRGLGMDDIAEEIERLRARVHDLEATMATLRGTLSEAVEPQVFDILHDVPPSTPR